MHVFGAASNIGMDISLHLNDCHFISIPFNYITLCICLMVPITVSKHQSQTLV